ncbi:dihydrodipicolinate synthase family protein [Occultella gossypii]|uniref:Dihydrodipicolinate synthase family protein n=1 Tax=Occultella gossypii TaxID=2800820 RepID=A0ABS7S3A8_9MICO|nr:dihydrodipicolinate synthase family protein [Occultella gossypii]MBZ2194577.1 dihydrodipicolinate synthase family protein [Occultella gossypii]
MRVQERLRGGVVIPAHPLAIAADGGIDLRAQRALTRYYLEAGADGLAVGVHTTQFELHADPGALREVWDLAAATVLEFSPETMLIAGLVGDTEQAVAEAQAAVASGYHAALLSPWGMADGSERALLERARAVGEVLPTIGFYLQDSVGGGPLGRGYWSALFDLESVIAVKTAPFDRYRTNDVVRALLDHDRWAEVALLTGNDDAIVHDLITPYRRGDREVRAAGGLLGQWAVGTRAAVGLVRRARAAVAADAIGADLLTEATDLVEVNAAVFDVDHDFAGCVPGVNEVLRQQGLLSSARCLDPGEALSPGQADLIGRVRTQFPELLDEEFVAGRRDEWLR